MVSLSLTIKNLYQDLERSLVALRSDQTSVTESRDVVNRALKEGQAHYGINTGFGALAQERIDESQLARLQRNLILSHSVGVGPLVPKHLCRRMVHLKIHSLGLGYSGISLETFRRLLLFAERDLIPAVPSKGSVGASGDLSDAVISKTRGSTVLDLAALDILQRASPFNPFPPEIAAEYDTVRFEYKWLFADQLIPTTANND